MRSRLTTHVPPAAPAAAATSAQIPPLFANHPTVFAQRMQLVLFGDSLTQNGSEPSQ
jgi:hypothetical protein